MVRKDEEQEFTGGSPVEVWLLLSALPEGCQPVPPALCISDRDPVLWFSPGKVHQSGVPA